jgi:hypothetical protein
VRPDHGRDHRYSVAMSLDGYIAGPTGEADWIIMDPEIDPSMPTSRSSARTSPRP